MGNISVVLLSMGGSDSSNVLICVLKINEGLTGLKLHEGEELMTAFYFGVN